MIPADRRAWVIAGIILLVWVIGIYTWWWVTR